MKKIILMAVAFLATGLWGNLRAQDCNEIVRPYFLFNNVDSNIYPAGKLEWRCNYSKNAFYLVDRVPENAFVYDFTELTNVLTKQHPSSDYIVDLNHLSYYLFDFEKFQCQHFEHTIYFRLKNGPKKFLAVRNIMEMTDRTERPQNYKQ